MHAQGSVLCNCQLSRTKRRLQAFPFVVNERMQYFSICATSCNMPCPMSCNVLTMRGKVRSYDIFLLIASIQ